MRRVTQRRILVSSVPEMVAKGNVKGLIKALRDSNGGVRFMAAVGLGVLGDPAAIAPLTTALSDKDAFVRRGAAEALGRLGSPVASGSLTKYPKDEVDSSPS
jgi:HEAT repeat protein